MQRQPGIPPSPSSSSSRSRRVAAGIPSGLAGAPQRCASVPARRLLSAAADGRGAQGVLKDGASHRVPPWNPGIRFRGTESLESFHVIDQEMPPDSRLSVRLGSSAWGDRTIHPRLLQKLPCLSETITTTPPTHVGKSQEAVAGSGKQRLENAQRRFSAPHHALRDTQVPAGIAAGPTYQGRVVGV
mmetsp:Transcript_80078/g.179197  ORF Transcript_80078/g.179197 Transcript_80078/m.179197 type:complete len:186 (-) Transcript_80078:50-607(-)